MEYVITDGLFVATGEVSTDRFLPRANIYTPMKANVYTPTKDTTMDSKPYTKAEKKAHAKEVYNLFEEAIYTLSTIDPSLNDFIAATNILDYPKGIPASAGLDPNEVLDIEEFFGLFSEAFNLYVDLPKAGRRLSESLFSINTATALRKARRSSKELEEAEAAYAYTALRPTPFASYCLFILGELAEDSRSDTADMDSLVRAAFDHIVRQNTSGKDSNLQTKVLNSLYDMEVDLDLQNVHHTYVKKCVQDLLEQLEKGNS